MSAQAFLAAMQLADSALPVGRFVHSSGLEAWLAEQDQPDPRQVSELVEAAVCAGVAPLDGTVVAHSWSAGSLSELVQLDHLIGARKLTPPSRAASEACGRQLAALAPVLAPADELVKSVADAVDRREANGNYAVIVGTLCRALGVPARESVLIELRSAAAGLLSAAVRLGAVTPRVAQSILAGLHDSLARAAGESLVRTLDELHASIPELEIHALAHRRASVRFFAT